MQLQFDMASVSHTHLQPHIYTDMLCTFWVVSVFETMVKCTDSPYLANSCFLASAVTLLHRACCGAVAGLLGIVLLVDTV